MSGTPLGPQSLEALLQLLRTNTVLAKLKVSTADDRQSEAVAEVVKSNSTLVDLDLVGPVSDTAHMIITNVLQNNYRVVREARPSTTDAAGNTSGTAAAVTPTAAAAPGAPWSVPDAATTGDIPALASSRVQAFLASNQVSVQPRASQDDET